MNRLIVFNNVSLDGYICDLRGDMSWAHNEDREWREFTEENAKGGGSLVMGRVTYDLMNSYWPTPLAAEHDPIVADRMNHLHKIVFSSTMKEATWNNTLLIRENSVESMLELKRNSDSDLVIMGSASIVSQMAEARLSDE